MRHVWILLAAGLVLLGASPGETASKEAVKRNNFGGELFKQGKLDEALVEFQQAVALDSGYALAQLNLAFTYDRLGRADEAIPAYQKAIKLDPQNGMAFNNLGVLYMKKEQNDEAITTLEQGLRVDPSNVSLQKNLETVRKNKAIVEEREARIADAKKQAEARPKDPRAAYNLTRVYASLGQHDLAIEWLAKALQLGFDDFGFLKADPALATLRGDPRFVNLLKGR